MVSNKIKLARSHRFFSNRKVQDDEILKILETARFSSCTKNEQVLRFLYTTSEVKCKEIFSAIFLGGYLKQEEKPTIEDRPRAAILIVAPTSIPNKNENALFFDIGILSQNIALSCLDFNLNSCIVSNFSKQKLEEIFEVPSNYSAKALIVIGEATDKVEIVDIKNGDNIAYYKKDGNHYVPKLVLEDLILKKL